MTPLNAETDRLNTLLTKCEQKLAALNLGVTAEIRLPDGGYLGFGKIEKDWRLFFQGLPGGPRVPLVTTSRALRVLATENLDALLAALKTATVTQEQEVEEAAARVVAFMGRIK